MRKKSALKFPSAPILLLLDSLHPLTTR